MSLITGPLQPDEIALLEEAMPFYGKQPGRWEIVCRDYLPHRQPQVCGCGGGVWVGGWVVVEMVVGMGAGWVNRWGVIRRVGAQGAGAFDGT